MTIENISADCEQDQSELDELNERLSASIGRCRSILDDCRSRLAANSNEGVGEESAPANDPGSPEA